MTKIVRCNCKHVGQDQLHGRGRRVANSMTGKTGYFKCTVCGTEHLAGRAALEDQKKKKK